MTEAKITTAGPNLLIIGAPRAGTTFLWGWLGQHPDIFAPPVKEPHYHLADRWPLGGPEAEAFTAPLAQYLAGKKAQVWGGLMSDPQDYAALYAPGLTARYRLEATPNYFAEGAAMATRLRDRLGPDIRVIVMLRDPVARALSQMRLFRQLGWEDSTDFAAALSLGPDRLAKGWAPTWDYLRYSEVAAPLAAWQAVFGDRLHVITHDALTYAPQATMARVLHWLDLPAVALPLPKQRNAAAVDDGITMAGAERAVAASGRLDLVAERAVLAAQSDPALAPPVVSIGMPVRNGGAGIAKALKSLLAQTYPHLHIHVCDNASTDDTAAIVADIAARDRRVTLHRFENSVGIQDSYRRALMCCDTAYFMFAPADDRWDRAFIDEAVRVMQADPTLAVCCGQITMVDGEGRGRLSKGTVPIAGKPLSRWTRALMRSYDASRIYGLLRADCLDGLIPATAPEGWDHYSVAKLALRGNCARIDVPAMTRGQTPVATYRALMYTQERGPWRRVFFMRHVAALFRDDPAFDTRPLRARLALTSFQLLHTQQGLAGRGFGPLRWLARRGAGMLRALASVSPDRGSTT
ncbi:glycosyltransferase [Octadecabacter sp. SW4]|uniref:glycosyltransferase n=1 Tax=Octadecabacter sp. SW4 TaxID=2602067 RepID=UPI0011C1FF6D|nr:glycosyltransferase [Octadecabacter sp. SW4]QEE35276.1 glycosyltransferase [Octadecabacter sp. SW4]